MEVIFFEVNFSHGSYFSLWIFLRDYFPVLPFENENLMDENPLNNNNFPSVRETGLIAEQLA